MIMMISGAGFTNVGKSRSLNEDCLVAGTWMESDSMDTPCCFFIESKQQPIFLIADGMGGHNAGAQASQFVSMRLLEHSGQYRNEEEIADFLRKINRDLFQFAESSQAMEGMGTTIAGLVARDGHLIWFNVGDSKIYRFRDGIARQLSIDDVPLRTAVSAKQHSITQALGGSSTFIDIVPHIGREPLVPGWRYLICSDGLTDVLSIEAIEGIMRNSDIEAADDLLKQALDAGAPDNVSVILFTVVDSGVNKGESS